MIKAPVSHHGFTPALRTFVVLGLLAALAGCAEQAQLRPKFPFISLPHNGAPNDSGEIKTNDGNSGNAGASLPGPSVPQAATTTTRLEADLKLKGPAKSVALEQVSLTAFIETVFGQTLGVTYQVDPQVAAKTDLVTMRTGGERSPQELLEIAKAVLKAYGIRVVANENVVRIVTDQALASEAPEIIRGRSAPDVPVTLRPIFQAVYLNAVSASDMQSFLTTAFGPKRITTTSFSGSSLILLSGLGDEVRAAVDAIRLLDQPRFAGRHSVKFEPIYWNVGSLAKKLVEVLRAEGYTASVGGDSPAPLIFIPVEPINLLIIFGLDQAAVNHALEWVHELDRPAKADPLKKTFVYAVTNTTVSNIADVLAGVVGGGTGRSGGSGAAVSSTQGPTAVGSLQSGGLNSSLPGQGLGSGAPISPSSSGPSDTGVKSIAGATGPKIIVDELQNTVIVLGTAEEYAQILPLLQTLDRAPRQALIEVTVAEVTLVDNEQLGVEWALSLGLGGGHKGSLGTLGGLGVAGANGTPSSGGANFSVLNSAGQVRAVINALASDSRVNILLTPRLLARSGTEAQIKVGTQVPIITSQSNSPLQTTGTTSILNQVSYRETGTLLRVKPTVHAGDRIDLDINQEVSQAQTNNVSAVSSPLIFSRSIVTKLPLKDGQTVLLGGLIQENRSTSDTKVPWLGDIPILGQAFRNQSGGINRTELLIFITPYIIKSNDDSDRIREKFESTMQQWPEVTGKLHW